MALKDSIKILSKPMKEQFQLLFDTAKEKAREYIVEGIFLGIFFSLIYFRDSVLSLLTPFLSKPPISWTLLEWLFLSILLLAVAFILFLIFNIIFKRFSKNRSKNILVTNFENSHPTPKEISNEIDNQPPLLQDSFANNYIGLKVKWEGIFDNIREIENQNVFVGVAFGNCLFYFYSSLKIHPILRTLKPKSAIIQVIGEIKSIVGAIELDKSKICSIEPIK